MSRAWAGCELSARQGCAPKAAPFQRRSLGEAGQAPAWEGRCCYPVTPCNSILWRWEAGNSSAGKEPAQKFRGKCPCSRCWGHIWPGVVAAFSSSGSALQKGCWGCQAWGTLVPWVPGGSKQLGAFPGCHLTPEAWQQMLWDQEKRQLRAHINFLTNLKKTNQCIFGWDSSWPASLCFSIFSFLLCICRFLDAEWAEEKGARGEVEYCTVEKTACYLAVFLPGSSNKLEGMDHKVKIISLTSTKRSGQTHALIQ